MESYACINVCKECYTILKGKMVAGILDGEPVVGAILKCPKCGYHRFEGHGKSIK